MLSFPVLRYLFTGSNFLLTSGSSLWLHFGTDESRSAAGFKLTVEPVGEFFLGGHLWKTFFMENSSGWFTL